MGCRDCIQKAKAAGKVVKAIAGVDLARKDTIEYRAGVCRGCEFALPCTHKPERKCKCGKCGCFITLKIRLKNEECPEGFWEKEE